MAIYVIMVSTNYELDENIKIPFFGDSRIVGYYTDERTATYAVEVNACDIQEHCYNYAFIEKIEEGLYNPACASERKVYVWSNDLGFTQIKDYECMKHFCGYTIG